MKKKAEYISYLRKWFDLIETRSQEPLETTVEELASEVPLWLTEYPIWPMLIQHKENRLILNWIGIDQFLRLERNPQGYRVFAWRFTSDDKIVKMPDSGIDVVSSQYKKVRSEIVQAGRGRNYDIDGYLFRPRIP